MLNKHRGHKHETAAARAEEIDDPQTSACFGLNCAAVQEREGGTEGDRENKRREAAASIYTHLKNWGRSQRRHSKLVGSVALLEVDGKSVVGDSVLTVAAAASEASAVSGW